MPKKTSQKETKQVQLLYTGIVVLLIIILVLIFAVFSITPSRPVVPQSRPAPVDPIQALTAPASNTPAEISTSTRASLNGTGKAVTPSQKTMDMLTAP